MLPTIMQVASLFLALAVTVLAKPVAISHRDVVDPPITNPTAKTVWTTGDTQTVTWDTSVLNGVTPSNPIAKIVLGTLIDGQESLMFESPIASNFSIFDGKVSLVVPAVPSGSEYIVCLFGDSGNISPTFTIVGTSGTSAVATSSNTLPPHSTTDPSTSTSLPPSAIQTTDPSTTVTSPASHSSSTSAATATATSPSSAGSSSTGTSGSSGSAGTSASGTSSASSSTTPSASAAASSQSQGTSGARGLSAPAGAIAGVLAVWALL